MAEAENVRITNHVRIDQVEDVVFPSYPVELSRVLRYRVLMGKQGIPSGEVELGFFEQEAGTIYPAHSHPAPEIYFIIKGRARWTVGEETFEACPGMAIYHPPNASHRMENMGDAPVEAMTFWWAPGGDRGVMDGPIELLEPLSGASPS